MSKTSNYRTFCPFTDKQCVKDECAMWADDECMWADDECMWVDDETKVEIC